MRREAFAGIDPGPTQAVLSFVFTTLSLVYLYVALRRFYGQGRAKTLVKVLLLWGGIFVVAIGITIISLVAVILQSR